MKLLLATGHLKIDDLLNKANKYDIVGSVNNGANLIAEILRTKPEAVLVTVKLPYNGSVESLLHSVKSQTPWCKICYISGAISYDKDVDIYRIKALLDDGIYNVYYDKSLSSATIFNLIDGNLTADDHPLIRPLTVKEGEIDIVQRESIGEPTQELTGYSNIFVVSSIKPGTGKSFLSTNLATAIAKYGKSKDGSAPKVALIEADFQNLSIGTLMKIEDGKRNLKYAIDKISDFLNIYPDALNAPKEKIISLQHDILECFKEYSGCDNLSVLVGSSIMFDDMDNVTTDTYRFLIEAIKDFFDVIIIDTNSSLNHVTTGPLLTMCKEAYYILNLDYNNVRNNARYRLTLEKYGILGKIKYVLNEDIPASHNDYTFAGTEIETLEYTSANIEKAGFNLVSKIPLLPKTVFLNHVFKGVPIVLNNDKYTEAARFEILTCANNIYPLADYESLVAEHNKLLEKKSRKFR